MFENNIKTDEEIVELVRKGDKEFYTELIKRYQSKLLRYAEFIIGDYAKASDAVQESFIKSYINLNSFNTTKRFNSWIYRIVHNEVINIINKNKRNIIFDAKVDFASPQDIEENYSKEETVGTLHKCLKFMDIKYSEPLTLYYLEDRSYEEIGDILRLPVGTVSTRISRAKALMRKICITKKK